MLTIDICKVVQLTEAMYFPGGSPLFDWLRPYICLLAGALFGAGWCCYVDAIVYSAVVTQSAYAFIYYLPGIIATFAVLLMGCVSREAAHGEGFADEGATCRARAVLLLAYMCSLGSLTFAAVLLFICKVNNEQGGKKYVDLWIPTSALVQSTSILMSGLLYWMFRSDSGSDSYALI